MVTELEDMTSLSERRLLKIGSVPFLRLVLEPRKFIRTEETYFNDMVGVKRMYSAYAASAKEVDADTIETTVETVVATELASAFSEDPSTFESDELIEVGFAFGLPLPQWIVLARE